MHQKGPSGNEYPPDGSIVAMKSGTSTTQGQTGQTSETGSVPPGSCSCDKTKHLVWDGYEGCNCICEKGFKFNEAGDCVPDLPETDGSEIEEALALELETLEGTKTIKPNEKVPVTLSHNEEEARVIARCKEIGQEEMAILKFIQKYKYYLFSKWDEKFVKTLPGFIHLVILEELSSEYKQLDCKEIFKDLEYQRIKGYRKVFEGDSGGSLSSPSSGKSIPLKLSLERGPLEVDAIQDYVDITVETPTASISSSGRNKFAAAYNPETYQTAVAALENPIVVQPSGGTQSPITLQSGQGIMIDNQGAGPVKPLNQIPAENTNGGSTYVSPDGKDIYGPTGGCYQDPFTGEITCVDASGKPEGFVSGQGESQGISLGGCHQDPVTGEITCVDSSGTPEDLSAP
jgi:hypothetical protein